MPQLSPLNSLGVSIIIAVAVTATQRCVFHTGPGGKVVILVDRLTSY